MLGMQHTLCRVLQHLVQKVILLQVIAKVAKQYLSLSIEETSSHLIIDAHCMEFIPYETPRASFNGYGKLRRITYAVLNVTQCSVVMVLAPDPLHTSPIFPSTFHHILI